MHAILVSNLICLLSSYSHQISCGGTYAKIAEPPGYKDKTKASKGVQKNAEINPEKPNVAVLNNQGSHKSGVQKNLEIKPGKPNVAIPSNQGSHKAGVQKNHVIKPEKPNVVIQSNQGSHKSEGAKDNCDTKRPHAISNFFHSTTDPKKTLHGSSPECEKSKSIESKLKKPSVVPEKEKIENSLESKKRKRNDPIKEQYGEGKKEFTVASAWLGYYADDESDEDIEPLTNKRTERRKRQKMMKNTMAVAQENMALATFPVDPSGSKKGGVRDFSLVPHENCEGGVQFVNADNVSAIDSDEILDAEPLDHSAPLPLPTSQDIVIYISDDSD